MQVVLSRECSLTWVTTTGACTEDLYCGLTKRLFKSCLTSQVSSLHVDEGPVAKDHWALVFSPPPPALPWLLLHLPPETKPQSSLSEVAWSALYNGLYKHSSSLRDSGFNTHSRNCLHSLQFFFAKPINRCLQCLNSDVPDWLMFPCPSLSAFIAIHAAYHMNSIHMIHMACYDAVCVCVFVHFRVVHKFAPPPSAAQVADGHVALAAPAPWPLNTPTRPTNKFSL